MDTRMHYKIARRVEGDTHSGHGLHGNFSMTCEKVSFSPVCTKAIVSKNFVFNVSFVLYS